jgi:hypothetical protein
MNSLRFLTFFYFLTLSLTFSLFAQENLTPKEIVSQDKMECYSIATEIDNLEYQKSVKCITKDAVCYIIQGFAMSCIPRNSSYPPEIPNLSPKPTNP